MTVQLQALDRELDRLEGLWSDGLSETYRAYLDSVGQFAAETQHKLALAAALIEVGLRLQGLGGRAAPPPTLLMGDSAWRERPGSSPTPPASPSRWRSRRPSRRWRPPQRPASRPGRCASCSSTHSLPADDL